MLFQGSWSLRGALPVLAHYVHDLSPFLWHWRGEWGVRYYGLAYMLGFLVVYAGLRYLWGRPGSPFDPARAGELLTWLVAGVFLGARIGYSLFYAWQDVRHNPLFVLQVWRGGMSSHGGFLGVLVALAWYARRRGWNAWRLADDVVTLAPAGLFLGRLANFINGELWGRPATVPWAVIFPEAPLVQGAMVPRHPSQLYQALAEGLLLGAGLLVLRNVRPSRRPGLLTAWFLWGYAAARFLCEFFREPDEQLGLLAGGLSAGQWLSLGVLAGGGIVWFWSRHSSRSAAAGPRAS